VRSGMVVMLDEGRNLPLQIAGQIVVPPGFLMPEVHLTVRVKCLSDRLAERDGQTWASEDELVAGLSGFPCAGGGLKIRPPWPL